MKAAAGAEEAEDVELAPPFLVPRPDKFPPPAVEVKVCRVDPKLHSPYLVPRQINPYVRICVVEDKNHTSYAKTSVKKNTKSPVWDETLWLPGADASATLLITVMDHNAVTRNIWLAKADVAIAALRPGTTVEMRVPIDIRKSITNTDVDADRHADLVLEVTCHDVQRWWRDAEISKRDAAEATTAGKPWFHLW